MFGFFAKCLTCANVYIIKLAVCENVTARVYDKVSRFGYKIDTADPASIYRPAPFPEELINDFADFIKN